MRLTCTDSGSGIPPEDAPRLFQPFSQLGPDHVGTGLGLYISRELARLHGGDLALLGSVPGRTVFALTLPVA